MFRSTDVCDGWKADTGIGGTEVSPEPLSAPAKAVLETPNSGGCCRLNQSSPPAQQDDNGQDRQRGGEPPAVGQWPNLLEADREQRDIEGLPRKPARRPKDRQEAQAGNAAECPQPPPHEKPASPDTDDRRERDRQRSERQGQEQNSPDPGV